MTHGVGLLAGLLMTGWADPGTPPPQDPPPAEVRAERPAHADLNAFFPLNPGDRWVYEERTDNRATGQTEDLVENTVTLQDGTTAVPVVTLMGGQVIERVYYRHDGDSALLVAFQAARPFRIPYPVLQVGRLPARWEVVGETFFLGAPTPMSMSGTARMGRQREFQGRRVDVLEVELNATVTVLPGTDERTKQVAFYGRGVGLLELRTERELPNRRRQVSVRRLLTYTPARP